jgi:hypothetical protein
MHTVYDPDRTIDCKVQLDQHQEPFALNYQLHIQGPLAHHATAAAVTLR